MMKTSQKIFIAISAAYFIIAVVMFAVVSTKEYIDSFAQILFLAGIIGTIMLISGIVLKFNLNNRPVDSLHQYPNGEAPCSLVTVMGVGVRMLGYIKDVFRFRELDGTWVSYTFFCAILPVFPIGCWRVKLNSDNSWAIFGSEKFSAVEILSIYLNLYGFLATVFSIIYFIAFCLS